MAAITTAKGRTRIGALRPHSPMSGPLKGGVVIPQGAMIDKDANGFFTNAATNTTGKVMGVAPKTYDTTGLADGAAIGEADCGIFTFANSAGADEITKNDVGLDCYVVDNNTVAKTSNSNARHVAGKIYSVEADGSIGVVTDGLS
jgi:hypothetical protein